MHQIKDFVLTYKRSLSDFFFYPQVLKNTFWYSLRYVYLLSFCVLFLSTVLIIIQLVTQLPKLPQFFNTLNNELRVAFPTSLIIKIKDGVISTNKEAPISIPIPSLTKHSSFNYFMVIDTKASSDDYTRLNTMILLTKDTITYPDTTTNLMYQTESTKQLRDVSITYPSYQNFLDRFVSFTNTVVDLAPWLLLVGVVLIPLIGSMFVVMMRLLYLLFTSFVLWGISQLFGNRYTYKQIFHMSMYGLTVPITLMVFLNSIGIYSSLIFTSSFFLWMVIILARNKKV